MKEHPIIMSTLMVQAILEDRKTKTRRTKGLKYINQNPDDWQVHKSVWRDPVNDDYAAVFVNKKTKEQKIIKLPYGYKGDRLWVKETFIKGDISGKYYYKTEDDPKIKWKPSIFMPKVACRLWLENTDIKIERLKNITKQDAIAEGIRPEVTGDDLYENYANVGYRWVKAKESYKSLWESINGEQSWDANPWVWVIDFKKIKN